MHPAAMQHGGMPPYLGWSWPWMYPPGATTGPYGYPPLDEQTQFGLRGKGRGKGEKQVGSAKQKAQSANTTKKETETKKPNAKTDIGNSLQPSEPPEQGTTVMLRNIPNRYTQNTLLALIDETEFKGRYDFVYLPMDFRNGVNLGYAFVNLLVHEDALRLMEKFQGFVGWSFDSAKVCEVSWAHPHQGYEEHIERYRNSPVMHPNMPDEYKPMVFKDGARIPFPPPTKAIRAPKLRPSAESPKASP